MCDTRRNCALGGRHVAADTAMPFMRKPLIFPSSLIKDS